MGAKHTGQFLRGLVIAFLGFDVIAKMFSIEPIYTATTSLGFSSIGVHGLAAFEAVLLIVALLPDTQRLGVGLLTVFLGGAVAAQIVANHSMSYRVFPIVVVSILWAGQTLADRSWVKSFTKRPPDYSPTDSSLRTKLSR